MIDHKSSEGGVEGHAGSTNGDSNVPVALEASPSHPATIAASVRSAVGIKPGPSEAPPSQEPVAVKPDHRIYFACECCADHAPENGVCPIDDIAVMPDGTWLCSTCYGDCEKSAYGLVASDVTDFEYPDFDELPKPKLYTSPTPAPSGKAEALPKRPDSIYSQFHFDNWTEADFAKHAGATRKTLQYLLELEAALSTPAPAQQAVDVEGQRLHDQYDGNGRNRENGGFC